MTDSSDMPDILAEVTARAAAHGRAERERWPIGPQMYVAACDADEEETQTVLLDVIHAFDAWLGSRHPTRLERIS